MKRFIKKRNTENITGRLNEHEKIAYENLQRAYLETTLNQYSSATTQTKNYDPFIQYFINKEDKNV